MKSIVNRFFLFAASTVIVGATAFGQTETTLKAPVPFGFHIPGGNVTAGDYVVQMRSTGGARIVHLYNAGARRSVLANTFVLSNAPGAPIHPRLVFRCGDAGCALSEIWTPEGGYGLPASRVKAHEYVSSIPLEVVRGN